MKHTPAILDEYMLNQNHYPPRQKVRKIHVDLILVDFNLTNRLDPLSKDAGLLKRLGADDEEAFSEIYQAYASALIGFASSKLYSLEEARDLVQDIFVCLWIDRKQLQIHTSIQSYLFGITRHRIIDHIRKNVTREKYAAMLGTLAVSLENNIEKNIQAKDIGNVIDQVVADLPPRTKEIYQLSRKENKTISEISKILNLSDQTVKNQLTSALKSLRASLDNFLS